jgi:hypothetical protein
VRKLELLDARSNSHTSRIFGGRPDDFAPASDGDGLPGRSFYWQSNQAFNLGRELAPCRNHEEETALAHVLRDRFELEPRRAFAFLQGLYNAGKSYNVPAKASSLGDPFQNRFLVSFGYAQFLVTQPLLPNPRSPARPPVRA